MLSERQVKQQFERFGKLLCEHNKQREKRKNQHNYIFEEGLFFGAWLAYHSMLHGEKK